MTLRMKDLQAIEEDLKKRKLSDLDQDSEKPLSIKQAVMKLAPTLLKKRSQGFGTADLVNLLSQHQITIKPSDLSRYLREYKRTSNGAPVKKMASGKTKPKQIATPKVSAISGTIHNQQSQTLATDREPRPDLTQDNTSPAIKS